MSVSLRAACLTPPAIGGIAVIQVTGPGADRLVGRHLRHRRGPVDLRRQPPHELRLCQLLDAEDPIDDAVVCVRTSSNGVPVVDLNLHGGARVVQRALLMLQREGVAIVPPEELLETSWPAPTRLHADALRLMPRARTRRVALWLARLPDLLCERLERILSDPELPDPSSAPAPLDERVALLDALLAGAPAASLLLDGVRVVLAGAPNSGKSTLANALAEREHAVVSDSPGTTRDWTEHPAAVEGVPFTIVDTAGLRATDDPIEQEAIRRARRQISQACLVIRVIDPTQPPDMQNSEFSALACAGADGPKHVVDVYNKSDLNPPVTAEPRGAVRVSAKTGDGIDRLRSRLLESVGLTADGDWPIGPFTPEQVAACRAARAAWRCAPGDRSVGAQYLRNLLSRPLPDGRASNPRV